MQTSIIVRNTDAEPISFDAFAKILYSGDIISTTHSIAVFNNSTMQSSMKASVTIEQRSRSKLVTKQTVTITIRANNTSCLKADSFLNIHFNPSMEYVSALNKCTIPFDSFFMQLL